MYRNLKAEMKREGITNEKMARELGINPATLSVKLNKKERLKFIEAKKIKETFFPELSTDYLFDYEE